MMRNDGETQSLRNANTFSEKDIEPFGGNFKKIIKQKIFKSDFERLPILVEYQKVIKYIQMKIKSKLSYRKIKKYIYIMYNMKDDQIWLKDALCGTIYFKNVLPDNGLTNYTCFDLDLFCVDDCKILLKLISFDRVHFHNDYINIYKKLKKNIKFTDKEMSILDVLERGKIDRYRILEEEPEGKNKKRKTIYSGSVYSIAELAKELKIFQQEAQRLYDNIALKISDAYVEWYEDNVYYLEKVKGKYKKCSRCGEIKLLNRFSEDKNRKDGLDVYCKKCRNK